MNDSRRRNEEIRYALLTHTHRHFACTRNQVRSVLCERMHPECTPLSTLNPSCHSTGDKTHASVNIRNIRSQSNATGLKSRVLQTDVGPMTFALFRFYKHKLPHFRYFFFWHCSLYIDPLSSCTQLCVIVSQTLWPVSLCWGTKEFFLWILVHFWASGNCSRNHQLAFFYGGGCAPPNKQPMLGVWL